jgi:hypothetical protein
MLLKGKKFLFILTSNGTPLANRGEYISRHFRVQHPVYKAKVYLHTANMYIEVHLGL